MPPKTKSNVKARPSPHPESTLEAAPLSDLVQIMKEVRLEPPTGAEFLSEDARRKVFADSIRTAYATSQRLPFLFPGTPLSRKSPAVSLTYLPEWHEWSSRHKLMNGDDVTDLFLGGAEAMVKEMGDKSLKVYFDKAFGLGERIAISSGRIEDSDWTTLRRTLRDMAGQIDQGFTVINIDGGSPACPILCIKVHSVHSALPVRSKANKSTEEKEDPVPILAVDFMLESLYRLQQDPIRRKLVDDFSLSNGKLIAYRELTLAPPVQQHLYRLLLHNHALLSKKYISERTSSWSPEQKALVSVSFITPIEALTFKAVAQIRTSPVDAASEKVCAAEGYCSEAHATSSWPNHKPFCLRSANPDLFLSRAKEAGCVLVPVVSAPFFVNGNSMGGPGGMHFANIGMQGQGGGMKTKMQDAGLPPKNEHGHAKFLVKVQKGGRVMIYDEKRTFQTSFGASMTDPMKWSKEDAEAYEKLSVEVEACERWDGLKAFFYCERVGDQLQIDVTNLPPQDHKW
ncbi:hypothetical protein P7C70_g57, partial [Phenoliferia sp. Uapishka_3]